VAGKITKKATMKVFPNQDKDGNTKVPIEMKLRSYALNECGLDKLNIFNLRYSRYVSYNEMLSLIRFVLNKIKIIN